VALGSQCAGRAIGKICGGTLKIKLDKDQIPPIVETSSPYYRHLSRLCEEYEDNFSAHILQINSFIRLQSCQIAVIVAVTLEHAGQV
jgi:hypothetical protein